MIALDGRSALSPFRLDRLNAQLDAKHAGTRVGAAWFVYFIDTASAPDADMRQRLAQILELDETPHEPASVWVVPRLGTISPWSSKATDILYRAGCGIGRVERGVAYRLERAPQAGSPAHAAVLDVLHDRMTQSVLDDPAQARGLFLHGSPGALRRIELGDDATDALAAANGELGLALADDEIEYLVEAYAELGRDPSDAELMMFAQANSEHCRHKVFNATWTMDGEPQEQTLFGMIRHTHATSPRFTLSAYSDNAAVVEGHEGVRLGPDPADGVWRYGPRAAVPYAIKVETHNHPTAIAPWPGAATGAGGEIRDEGATGIGGKPKAGLAGFSVSHLRIPGLPRPWENERPLPPRMASAFEIMRDGPLGAAAFNNEFGRPCLGGYFRDFEVENGKPGVRRGYDKPIMIAGGLANLRPGHVHKRALQPGDKVVVLGGPAMLIGLGGGAASSMSSGASSAELDFASVQRDNPEMQRRCQEVIDACCAMGEANPLVSIHDVGAGGLSNAIPELLHDAGVGGRIDLSKVPVADPSLTPMQIWSNESQERYVLALRPQAVDAFAALCERERCPFAVVGEATGAQQLRVENAPGSGDTVIDLPMQVLFGKPPRMHRDAAHRKPRVDLVPDLSGIELTDALHRVLRMPGVGSKSFLITIGDRSVGGLCARDPMVGPWQVPVADCAITLTDFEGYAGEAMAMAERAPVALLSSADAARMAVGEAITNLAAAPIGELGQVRLSANWMAAVNHDGEDAALFDAVRAVGMELCPQLDIAIPVGKDSLSMQTVWSDPEAGEQRTVAPVSLVVTGFARVHDVRAALTPQLRLDRGDSDLWLVDLGGARDRLGASALTQVFNRGGGVPPDLNDPARLAALFALVQEAIRSGIVLAYHDRSDGGVIVTLLEMAFAGHCGLEIHLDGWAETTLRALFNEELGAVLQVSASQREAFEALLAKHDLTALAYRIGHPREKLGIKLLLGGEATAKWNWQTLFRAWNETSHAMQRLRDNPDSADAELEWRIDDADPGIVTRLGFDPADDIAAPYIARGVRPRVAILREQGVNGQVEMAAAFTRAGFDAVDVHMTDLLERRHRLSDFKGIAACGGFSYGDVLGAGRGWATSILHSTLLRDQFESLFADPARFALGVCNGCQMLSHLRAIIPGSRHWPQFLRNASEQYEARLVTLEVQDSPSLFLQGMQGSRLPVVVAHGEGRVEFPRECSPSKSHACLRYVDARGKPTEHYPLNPNGSPGGMAGFTAADGRVTIMMPHPERVFRSVQLSWRPPAWGEDSPWMRLFRNARAWVG